jgi:hypothetical protein
VSLRLAMVGFGVLKGAEYDDSEQREAFTLFEMPLNDGWVNSCGNALFPVMAGANLYVLSSVLLINIQVAVISVPVRSVFE